MTVFGLKIRFYSKLVTINQTQQTIFLRVAVWKCWTKKKVFKWCKISAIQHDDFTQKEKFPAVQIRSRWSWSGRGFCAIFTSRIISESGTIFFLAKPIMFDSSWPTFVYTWYFETLHFWSYNWPFHVVLSQFRLKAVRVSGTNDVSTVGCDLVLLPSPYEVVIGIWLIIKKVSF